MIVFKCKQCGAEIKVNDDMAGEYCFCSESSCNAITMAPSKPNLDNVDDVTDMSLPENNDLIGKIKSHGDNWATDPEQNPLI